MGQMIPSLQFKINLTKYIKNIFFIFSVLSYLTLEAATDKDPYVSSFNPSASDTNLRNCFHNLNQDPSVTCQATNAPKAFNLNMPKCDPNSGVCNGMQLLAGCYSINFIKASDLTAAGCKTPQAPFKVEILYTTQCLNNATSCKKESVVNVKVNITNEGLPNETYNDSFKKLNDISIPISSSQSGNPTRVACATMVNNGFRWDESTQKCVRPPDVLCTNLGFTWKNGQCVAVEADCRESFPAAGSTLCSSQNLYCSGYRYPVTVPNENNVSCLCSGTSTTTDLNGRTCIVAGTFSKEEYEDPLKPAGFQQTNTSIGGTNVNTSNP